VKTTIVASKTLNGPRWGRRWSGEPDDALQLAPMCVAVDGGANLAVPRGRGAALVATLIRKRPKPCPASRLRVIQTGEQETNATLDKKRSRRAAP